MTDLAGPPHFAAFMLSCPDRAALCGETLDRLARTDWPAPPVVVVDQGTHPDRRLRQVIASRDLLARALGAPAWDYLLFLEDDLEFNPHLHHNLLGWWPVRAGRVGLASLYNPGVRLPVRGPRCAAADPATVYGSQALLLSRPCADYIITHYEEAGGMQDIRFSRLAARLGPIFYHTPSLVQHVGRASVWGGVFHQAADFDPEFRA